jgi:hypothetical protein
VYDEARYVPTQGAPSTCDQNIKMLRNRFTRSAPGAGRRPLGLGELATGGHRQRVFGGENLRAPAIVNRVLGQVDIITISPSFDTSLVVGTLVGGVELILKKHRL